MAEYLIQDTTLTELADTIRSLNNLTDNLTFSEMKTVVNEAVIRENGIFDESIDVIENNRLVSIRKYGFCYNQVLKNISFPLVANIGDYGFYKCSALEYANIPSVTNIGAFCFKGCTSLLSANFPYVVSVEQGAFDECVSMNYVNLQSLTAVNPLTFRKCQSITTIDLPVVTSIGTQAFYDSGLTSLTLHSNTVVILKHKDAFYFTPIEEGTGYIYVPSNLVNSYKAADEWSTYANQIMAIA